MLEEFYENLQSVGVSAITGEGMTDFFDKVFCSALCCIMLLSLLTLQQIQNATACQSL